MISYALNSKNDIIIENGNIKLVSDGAEVLQNVRSRLLFYLGEWFLDLNAGVPYFQEILVKPANLANAESIFKTKILSTPGVDTLTNFEMDYDSETRLLTVKLAAETTYKNIINEEVTVNV